MTAENTTEVAGVWEKWRAEAEAADAKAGHRPHAKSMLARMLGGLSG